MILFLIVIHICAICVHTYLLLLERKYCKHLSWWWDPGAWIFFVLSLLPFIGIISSIVGCADYARNIIRELDKEKKYD